MINVAVIHVKDLSKYLVKIGIIFLILFLLTRFLNVEKMKEKGAEVKSFFSNHSYSYCLDSTLPSIANHIEENTEKEKLNLSKTLLGVEFKVLDHIIQTTDLEINVEELTPDDTEELVRTEVATDVTTEVVTENNIATSYTDSYGSVEIKNQTDYGLTEEILTPNIDINKKNVLIFHTHTCESYTSSEAYPYEPTGNYRTTDLNYTVARVGTELENNLKSYGFQVIHDMTYHDHPAYSGSYNRSLETVQNILSQNQGYDIVFDLHRDAVGSGSEYAPKVKIGEEYAAQIMFVIGTNAGGLEHPNWQQNLKFAVKVQEKANELYPGLFRPILLTESRYNQHVAKAANIIEVGATGNTLEECLNSMKYLAKVMSEI